jgi:hypothetical protein
VSTSELYYGKRLRKCLGIFGVLTRYFENYLAPRRWGLFAIDRQLTVYFVRRERSSDTSGAHRAPPRACAHRVRWAGPLHTRGAEGTGVPSTRGGGGAGLLASAARPWVLLARAHRCRRAAAEARGGGEGDAEQGDGGEQALEVVRRHHTHLDHLLPLSSGALWQGEHRANRAQREEGSRKGVLQPAVGVSVAKHEVAQGTRAALVEERHE